MARVRDISWATTSVATGTTLVIPTPAYALNDLMLAIVVADTGAGAWTSAGWTHVTGSPSTNTAQLVVMWKIATASEAASFTFTSTVAESYNGAIITIEDVNTATPFGATPVISFANQAAAAKFNFPAITTNTANSLILYAYGNSGVGVPSILEGPAYGLLGADGVAESLGIGWGFKAATGLTPANVGCSNVATGAGRVMVLQIAPPSGGAQIIPAYCTADDSIYLDPLNGLTAYNANTAFASTADTNFGTTLGGLTAGDGTAAAVTDVGINSFHSAARITTVSASQNLAGADLVFAVANRPNVTGKNVMVHLGPSTEGQLQRFTTVSSGKGIWLGMRSGAATNYKIWQVYGRELGALRQQPVVINSAALNTKASAGTLDATAVQGIGFWVAGTGITTTAWDFLSMWALGTTTVCGGNAANPLTVEGIVESASVGKERRSVLRQGNRQMLSYQALQFGNGTDPLYLDLGESAIEFPRQYDAAKKAVTYNSVDNVAGVTFYPGAGHTVDISNCVFSSPSKFHWRWHASSSAGATLLTTGAQVIGAGDLQLRALTFNKMTFSNCLAMVQNGATLTACSFTNSTLTADAPALISGSTFASGGIGHALVITAPGTYNFSGNQFSGYGAGGSTDAAIYNNSGGAVTLNITGGGSVPTVRNGAGASTTVNSNNSLTITGIQAGTDVVILNAGTTTIVAQADAIVGTSYVYAYSGAQTVDIGLLKNGLVPLYIRGVALSTSDSSLPVNQTADRNFI